MRYKISNFEYLKRAIAEINDDYSRHWSDYPCLIWGRALNSKHGYGYLTIGDRSIVASRVAFQVAHNLCILPGFEAAHHCDTPACFRPIHLFLSTHKENMRDCQNKGRIRHGDNTGENHWSFKRRQKEGPFPYGNAKLTLDQIQVIRAATGRTKISLAKEYGLDRHTIYNIINRSTWKDLS